jgi:hypothetical protein
MVHVRRMTMVNFRLIAMFWNHDMLSLSRIRVDDPGALQKLRADLDPPGLGGVNLEANFVIVDVEVDDPAAPGEIIHVANGYDAGVIQALQDVA